MSAGEYVMSPFCSGPCHVDMIRPDPSAAQPIAAMPSAQDEALRALNNRHARETSHLDARAWRRLVDMAFAALAIDPPAALVVALDQDAPYDSPNFLWFRRRYPRFVYVDRVVVSENARGRGLARRLYEAVTAQARRAGHNVLACEVNLVPANPASDAFHARLGFAEVGRATLPGGAKTVRYLAKSLV